MGSLASYEASLVAVYKRDIKLKEKNSDEDIQKFLKNKPNFGKLGKEIDFDDVTLKSIEDGLYIGYYAEDYEGDYVTVYGNVFSEDDYVEESEIFCGITKMGNSDLEYLDLDILKDFEFYTENSEYDKEVSIANLYESIYCSSDNSSSKNVKIPKNILEDLANKKCKLVLQGDGSGDHC